MEFQASLSRKHSPCLLQCALEQNDCSISMKMVCYVGIASELATKSLA